MLLNIESKKKYFGLNENENNVWDLVKAVLREKNLNVFLEDR